MKQNYAIIIPAVDEADGSNAIQIVCDKSVSRKIMKVVNIIFTYTPVGGSLSFVVRSIKSGAVQFDDPTEILINTDVLNPKQENQLLKEICKELETLLGARRVACLL